jgi:hypothetical protein
MARVEIVLGSVRAELKNSDVVFVVSDEEGKFGELRVSRGSVDWWPVLAKQNAGATRISWKRFAKVMADAPSNVRRRGTRTPVRAHRE